MRHIFKILLFQFLFLFERQCEKVILRILFNNCFTTKANNDDVFHSNFEVVNERKRKQRKFQTKNVTRGKEQTKSMYVYVILKHVFHTIWPQKLQFKSYRFPLGLIGYASYYRTFWHSLALYITRL